MLKFDIHTRGHMRRLTIKFFILFQVALYLTGGHATAHGLAWCISDEGRAHVATAAGCMTEQKELPCSTASFCIDSPSEAGAGSHSGTECRHLPVTSPHANGLSPSQRVESAGIIAIIPPPFNAELQHFIAPLPLLSPFSTAVELPRPVALVSLRTIVLLL